MTDSRNALADMFEKAKTVRLFDNGQYFYQEVGSQISEQARLEVISALRAPSRIPDGSDTLANRAVEALRELTATVRGECPSLLNEDSGGNARLDLEIDEILEAADNAASVSVPAVVRDDILPAETVAAWFWDNLDAPATDHVTMVKALTDLVRRARIDGASQPAPVEASDDLLSNVRLALLEICECGGALRQGGPDPMDLEGLSDRLHDAVQIAAEALRKIDGYSHPATDANDA